MRREQPFAPKIVSQIKRQQLVQFPFYEQLSKFLMSEKNIDKVTITHSLLITHRKYLIKNILIKPGESIYFKWTSYLYEVFIGITDYIYNNLLLIKYLCMVPNKEIKINAALTFITNEMLNGCLTYSLKIIVERCGERFKGKAAEPIYYSRLILMSYLKVLSIFIKLTHSFNCMKLNSIFLQRYGEIFEMILNSFNGSKRLEEALLKTNLYFNIGNQFVMSSNVLIGLRLYNQIVAVQRKREISNNVIVSALYNMAVIYYVKEDMKNCEKYIEEAYKIKRREVFNSRLPASMKDKRMQFISILIFYGEIKMEQESFDEAIKYLKEAIDIIKELKNFNNNKTLKSRGSGEEININNFYKRMKTVSVHKKKSPLLLKSTSSTDLNNSVSNFETIDINEEDSALLVDQLQKFTVKIGGLFDKIIYMKTEKDSLKSPYGKYSKAFTSNLLRKSSITPVLKDPALISSMDYSNSGHHEVNPQTMLNPTYIPKETSEKILSFLKDTMKKKKKIIDKEYDVSDFKNFFLLLTKLSYHQIEVLNETQSTNMPMSLYKNLPILFSKQFKNSLNPGQRAQLDKLKVLSLIRCRVLKDVNKPISVDNLKYSIFHTKVTFNEFQHKKYSQIKDIISKFISTPISYSYSNAYHHGKKNTQNEVDTLRKEVNELFRYNEKYDLNNLRRIVINNIKENVLQYSQEDIDELIQTINSGVFVRILNEMKLNEIYEIEEDPDIIVAVIYDKLKERNVPESDSIDLDLERIQ